MSTPLRNAAAPVRVTYSISDLAREFALTTRAIRFYEDCGLLAPRRDKRTRVYGERERVRLKLILRGKRLGLALSEIGELLDLYDIGDRQHTQMLATSDRCRNRITTLHRQKQDIDTTIAELEEFVALLDERLQKGS